MVIRQDSGDTRLLQHDFGDPDAVGIAARAPGKVAAVRAEPVEQAALKMWKRSGRELRRHAGGIVARATGKRTPTKANHRDHKEHGEEVRRRREPKPPRR